jgi:alkanesulfonate monooxygenase SsuD/methylene tetrahydromethanopterin reductase-like flavin-dependent oxidoreductase (luciferase family)
MRTGLFCTYENPRADFRAAYADQTQLVRRVETLGFDEAWIAEHHFNPDASSASCLSILAHLAARTSCLRLGSAAVLLPLRNPLLVAEDVATLDILSEGRFNFGVASGGPFPIQNKHFGVGKDESRDKTLEALTLIDKLLYEESVSFEGRFFKTDGVSLAPKPVQTPIPTFVATSTVDTVQLAAAKDYGIMGAPPFPLEIVSRNIDLYRKFSPARDPRLILIRFYHVASTHEQAVAEATVWLRPFIERMKMTTAAVRPDWTPWFMLDRLIDDSLIGTVATIRAKVARIEDELHPHSLILKPMSPEFSKRESDLELFAREIRPAFAAAA